jgi:hypothetical protein
MEMKEHPMKTAKTLPAALPLLLLTLLSSGCAGGPAPTPHESKEPYAYLAERAATRAPVEEFRLTLKRVHKEDPLFALRLLHTAERAEATYSQRVYARLLIEKKLAAGALREHAAELRRRLALSWHLIEPRSLIKAKANLEALAEVGMPSEMAQSKVLQDIAFLTGARLDPEAQAAGSSRQISYEEKAPWASSILREQKGEMEFTVWGGGCDRLLNETGVLAFLMNDLGEPMLYGRQLWIRNESSFMVVYSVPAADVVLRELRPGDEELIPLRADTKIATGIDLKIRSAYLR